MLFLSNAFYPLDYAPSIVVELSRINPFQWLLNGLHYAEAWNMPAYLLNLCLLFAIFMLGLLLAVKTFRFTDS